MKKKVKKRLIFIVIIVILIIKITQIILILNIKNKIENFETKQNTYYEVDGVFENFKMNLKRLYKDNVLTENIDVILTGNKITRIIDFNKNEEITIDEMSNTYKVENDKTEYDIKLKNLPKTVHMAYEISENINNGNIFSILNYFKILYIVPVNYNDTPCYKIKTTRENLYVDRNTLYPIYLEYFIENSSNNKDKMVVNYVFEENTKRQNDFNLNNLEKYSLK